MPDLTGLLREIADRITWADVRGQVHQALALAEEQERQLAAFGECILRLHGVLPATWVYTDARTTVDLAIAEISTLRTELAAAQAALLALHGPPPGPLCVCVACCEYRECPGQVLANGTSALDAHDERVRREALESAADVWAIIRDGQLHTWEEAHGDVERWLLNRAAKGGGNV